MRMVDHVSLRDPFIVACIDECWRLYLELVLKPVWVLLVWIPLDAARSTWRAPRWPIVNQWAASLFFTALFFPFVKLICWV